jgi:AcrR family transcriptional regulator
MKIRELEHVSGVHRSTIHHYVNLGLLPRPRVAGPKLHVFGEQHVEQLRQIQKLRAEGWALPRIREHLRKRASKARAAKTRAGGEALTGTHRQILEHATHLFAQRGYHGVRLTDVARSLGIGKATLYRYFTSKQALFVECVERVRFTLVPKTLRDLAERSYTLPEQGRGRARAVLVHFKEYRALTQFLGSIAEDADAAVATRAKTELHSMITNAEPYLKRLMAEGARACDSELLAYMLWGALMGAGERMTLDGKYTLEEVLEAYLQFITFGMRAPA